MLSTHIILYFVLHACSYMYTLFCSYFCKTAVCYDLSFNFLNRIPIIIHSKMGPRSPFSWEIQLQNGDSKKVFERVGGEPGNGASVRVI